MLRLLPAAVRDEVLADMDERHAELRRRAGARAADRWYRDQLVRSIRPALSGRRRTSTRPLPGRETPMLSGLVQDLRFAVRWWRANPGFTFVVLGTLALGIGSNTAMFSVVRGVLLRPLPYADAERIGRFYNSDPETRTITNPLSRVEGVEYRDAAANLPSVESLLIFDAYNVTLTGIDVPQRVRATFAPDGFFELFGVGAQLGRTFLPEEDRPGADDVVVLSHGLWRDVFGARQDVLGERLEVDGRPRRVVGVMPADFDYYVGSRLWVPLALDEAALTPDLVRSHGTPALIKLAAGASPAAAERDLDALIARVLERYPDHEGEHVAMFMSMQEWLTGDIRPTLLALMAFVACLMLVACANVANLLLARAETRRRELAVRRAMGAGDGRLTRQLLVESVALALVAGGLATAVTWWARDALVGAIGGAVPRADAIRVDLGVLGFALLAAVATGCLFGLAPLVRWRRADLGAVLREGRGSGELPALRMRQGLIVGEVGLVVVLLLAAGLMAQSFLSLARVDPGIDVDSTLTFQLALPETGYGSQPEVEAFFERLLARLQMVRGVEAVGAVSWLPFADPWSNWGIEIDGKEMPDDTRIPAYTLIMGDYFRAIGIPLLRGRVLEPEVAATGVVITRATERAYFADEDPMGARLRLAGQPEWRSVVGIVEDWRNQGYSREPDPGIYIPHTLLTFSGSWFPRQMTVVLRSNTAPNDLIPAVREIVQGMDPDLPVERLLAMSEVIDSAILDQPRMTARLLAVFATLALLLGGIGVYGVVAWAVQRETREIGVRLALGARATTITRHVGRRALAPCALGLVIGLGAGSWVGARLLAPLLVGVSPTDVATMAVVTLVLGTTAILAVAVPARRALRIDPVNALRQE